MESIVTKKWLSGNGEVNNYGEIREFCMTDADEAEWIKYSDSLEREIDYLRASVAFFKAGEKKMALEHLDDADMERAAREDGCGEGE